MKELDKEFNGRADQKAFRFRQLQRTDTHALYEKSLKSGNGGQSWEVFQIVKQQADTMTLAGQTINLEAKERFPLSSEWGTLGWSFQSLEDAKRKFYSLTPE